MITTEYRTAIITWINYYNFGTFLQAYALQTVLKSIGYPNNIINDKRFVFCINANLSQRIKQLTVNILHPRKVWMENIRKSRCFKNFARRFLNIDNDWSSREELSNKYDIFVCGSDQIWSPIIQNHFGGFYFASFASKDKWNIAYAPSLGLKRIVSSDYIELVKPWLDKFKFISMREKSGTEIISQITKRENIETVLDPTLLLTSKQWKNFENSNKISAKTLGKPYMLAYFLSFNRSYLKRAYELAHSKGLILVCLNTSKIPHCLTDKLIIGAGPMDFLSLIANSEYVFTDSFHGTIFALQFHKPFITVKRFSDTADNCQNSRIENLLNIVGITDNLLDEKSLFTEPAIPNWDKIESALNKERDISYSFLYNALNN